MAVSHIGVGVLKAAIIGVNLIAAAMLLVDPSVKVALIVATPAMITGIGTLALGFLTRRDAGRSLAKQTETHAIVEAVQRQTDGINTALTKRNADQRVELDDAKSRADRSEAASEATEAERTREK